MKEKKTESEKCQEEDSQGQVFSFYFCRVKRVDKKRGREEINTLLIATFVN